MISLDKKNILVIDDSLINRQLLKMSLEKNYHFLLASGGVQGLELARNTDNIV